MSYDKEIVRDILCQIGEAIDQLKEWNSDVKTIEDYVTSPGGMKTLAATCMMIEAIGEGIKKIERRTNGTLLNDVCPETPWKEIMGMRDHIAHGYFQIDAGFILNVVNNDLTQLQDAISKIIAYLDMATNSEIH